MESHEKNKFMTANSNSKLRSYHSSKLLAFEIFQSEMLSFDNSESSLSLLVVGHSIHFLNGPFFIFSRQNTFVPGKKIANDNLASMVLHVI